MVRADFLVDATLLSKVQGVPFAVREIERAILEILGAAGEDAAAGADGERPVVVVPNGSAAAHKVEDGGG
jgi:hypothetical protein